MLSDLTILAEGEPWIGPQWIALGGFIVVVGALMLFWILGRYLNLWIQCVFTRADINLWQLVMMSLRRVNPGVIVRSKVMAVQAGLTRVYPITTRALEAHYLAGGNVPNVILALIAAHRATSNSTGRRPKRSIWLGVTFSRPSAPALTRRSSTAPIGKAPRGPWMPSPATE